MVKKICNCIFVVMVGAMLLTPFLFTDWISGGISESENRTLAKFPKLILDGRLNNSFPAQFDIWFVDHLGFHEEMISLNAARQYKMFDVMLQNSEYHIGPTGDLNYATPEMIQDYAHTNLRSEEQVAEIGQSYQIISDWLAEKGITFYYVQCYDKHSIYPEHFRDDIKQIGDVSKTDQVINYLLNETTVKTISLKDPLIQAKNDGYEVYSNWGDPSHWTPRGAYIGYQHIMEQINADFGGIFPVLQEEDYDITMYNCGMTLHDVIHEDDYVEWFEIQEPKAQRLENSYFEEIDKERHSQWVNPSLDNDTRMMLMCDSYIKYFILEDFAESFSEVGLIWGDFTRMLPEAVDHYQPDIVIYECVERVDRSTPIVKLAKKIAAGEY